MQDDERIKEYADEWAYDMEINGYKGDGIVNIDVINQSIEMILATPPRSRLFNLNFGSTFSLRVFDNITESALQNVLNDTIEAIKRWEDRIVIIQSLVTLDAKSDENTILLTIPYIVKNKDIMGTFSKVIRQ